MPPKETSKSMLRATVLFAQQSHSTKHFPQTGGRGLGSTVNCKSGSASSKRWRSFFLTPKADTKGTGDAQGAAYGVRDLPLMWLVGASVASFWRGAWFCADALLYPEDQTSSCAASCCLGFGGFSLLYTVMPRLPRSVVSIRLIRFTGLYLASLSIVFTWRGTWLGWDILTAKVEAIVGDSARIKEGGAAHTGNERNSEVDWKLFLSGITSHVVSLLVLVACGHASSVLAPPARISMLADLKCGSYLPDLCMFLKAANALRSRT